jgi:hypothetical protein
MWCWLMVKIIIQAAKRLPYMLFWNEQKEHFLEGNLRHFLIVIMLVDPHDSRQ